MYRKTRHASRFYVSGGQSPDYKNVAELIDIENGVTRAPQRMSLGSIQTLCMTFTFRTKCIYYLQHVFDTLTHKPFHTGVWR